MDSQVRALIARQSGVISRKQAVAHGMSARQIDHRLERAEWIRVHPGVFRLDTAAACARQALWAASLWSDDGVLSGLGAAWWWNVVPDPPRRWEFLIVGTNRRSRQPGISLQRRWVDPADLTVHEAVRVVARPLAVLRGAVSLEQARRGAGVRLIDRSKQTNIVTPLDLEGAFLRNRGTWGTTAMRALLQRTGDRAHSDLERLGISILEDAGITGFAVNLRLTLSNGRAVELDVAFEEARVGLEFDGFPYHSSMAAQEADARRQNDLVREGWTILRFPPAELESHRTRLVDLVLTTLRRASVHWATSAVAQ